MMNRGGPLPEEEAEVVATFATCVTSPAATATAAAAVATTLALFCCACRCACGGVGVAPAMGEKSNLCGTMVGIWIDGSDVLKLGSSTPMGATRFIEAGSSATVVDTSLNITGAFLGVPKGSGFDRYVSTNLLKLSTSSANVSSSRATCGKMVAWLLVSSWWWCRDAPRMLPWCLFRRSAVVCRPQSHTTTTINMLAKSFFGSFFEDRETGPLAVEPENQYSKRRFELDVTTTTPANK